MGHAIHALNGAENPAARLTQSQFENTVFPIFPLWASKARIANRLGFETRHDRSRPAAASLSLEKLARMGPNPFDPGVIARRGSDVAVYRVIRKPGLLPAPLRSPSQ
jgi:hypothetical protein